MTKKSDQPAAAKPKRKRGRPRSHGESVRAAKQFIRCSEALKMKAEGLTHMEIAAKLGWRTKQAVSDALKKYTERAATEDVTVLRAVVDEQLRMMTEVTILNASSGDPMAIHAMLAIINMKGKIHSDLFTPTKHEITGKDGEPLTPTGLLVVPSVVSEETWAELAAKQQQELADKEASVASSIKAS